jgi:outer membrane protein assembly factor BamB
MKMLIILLFCLFYNLISAQTTCTFRLKDTKGKPLENTLITAKNEALILTEKTDFSGKAIFTFIQPGTYSISYLEIKNATKIEVEEGYTATVSKTLTYDPTGIFAVKPSFNRKNVHFSNVNGNSLMNKPNTAKVTVLVQEKNGTKVNNQKIELVSEKDKVKYNSTTNATGNAIFYVPINQDYEIDIDEIEAMQKFKIGDYQNAEYTEVVYFEKTNLREIQVGDTLIQNNNAKTVGTSTHHLFTFILKNYQNNPSVGEKVYLKSTTNNTVYQSVTDETGTCFFLLKKGSNYLVNLKYENEICLVNATETRGFSSSMETRRYRGTQAIEEMLTRRNVNKDGFVINHDATPINKATPKAGYLTKTAKGFDLNFSESGPIGTPTLVEDKIFTQEGFHSPNFYCLDANTGSNIWGIQLGESGISPIVHHAGVLLINTYSCTLYAIDAKNGNLLWSKWLAGTIYSTPSAAGNSVYVVYNNGYNNPKNPSENYVLASFDLQTGKENWMAWIDKEVIACPVVDGNEVHVASQSGNYFVFDKETGAKINTSKTIKALTSPTVTSEYIYITTTTNGQEQVTVLDRKTLKTARKYTPLFQTIPFSGNGGCYGQMNYNGAHPIVYKNEFIILLDSKRLLVFSALTEQLIWKQAIETNPNQVPIVANDKIIIAAKNGGIWSFDLKTGNNLLIEKTDMEIDGQPIGYKDFMFIAATGVLKMIKSNHRIPWTQWNKDAGHNTVWK